MIPKASIEEYLNAPRDDHRWVKKLTHKELDQALATLQPPPKIFKGCRLHQKAAILLGIAFPQFGYWLDMGCVDGDTEYLSPVGWIKIKDYRGGVVAQYHPQDRTATFVEPLRYISKPAQEMFQFKTLRGCDQVVSPDHKMLVISGYNGNEWSKSHVKPWKHSPIAQLPDYATEADPTPWCFEVSASEIWNQGHLRFDTTFLMDGPGFPLSPAQLRVQVAVHADGYLYCKSKVGVRVKKERKKIRMRKLLGEAGIEYRERDCGGGYSGFNFKPPLHTKKYGVEWYSCSFEQKKIICDEVGHWDGSFDPRGTDAVGFFTRSKHCADFIQFCFSSTGRRAFLADNGPRVDRGNKTDYVVHVIGKGRTTNLAHLRNGKRIPAPGGMQYCFEVPSGYLVLRRNGNIFVTGNSGKTLVSLELLNYWWEVGKLKKALILVKSDKAFGSWERQIKQYGFKLPYITLEGSSEQKWRALATLEEGLIFVAYPGVIPMVTKKEQVIKGKNKGKTKWKLDDDKVAKLIDGVQGLVMDESTCVGHHTSLYYKLCDKIANTVNIRYALAGRPFGRDPEMLWAQQDIIDRGESLGETLGLFREAFYTAEENPYVKNKHIKTFKFDKRTMPSLMRLAHHRSISYGEKECGELPALVREIETIKLPGEAEAYYQRVIDGIVKARGNIEEMKNAFMRMRQLSSGFLNFRNLESEGTAEIAFEDNPKLDRLLEFLEDLPQERKALVFYEFTYSGRRIWDALQSRKQSNIWLWSGTKNSKQELNKFMEDPDCQVAIINNKVGAYSLDGLQVANYTFFYETPVGVIDREQAERRARRQGQTRVVFQYDFVVKGTLDAKILEYHRDGDSLLAALRADPQELISSLKEK